MGPAELRRAGAAGDAAPYRRRRLRALGALACLSALAGAVVGSDGGPVAGTLIPTPYCETGGSAGLERAAGQGVVVRMEERATPELLRAARDGSIGGVVLFPPEGTPGERLARELARLRRAALLGGAPPPIASIDQEGGIVERLPALAPQVSPYAIGLSDDRSAARLEGSATGIQLAKLGIDVNLAPVLDVPSSGDQFMAPRAFGDSPEQVSRLGVAFAVAMQRHGVAATAKHFPGLGQAALNTDFAPTVVEASRGALRADLRPFADAADAGVRLVMVSSAAYPALGSDGPAVLSPEVVSGLLRGRLGFQGAVVSDDLLTPALSEAGTPVQVALAAKAAGVDLLLFARRDVGDIAGALAGAADSGRLDPEALRSSCERVVALKDELSGDSALE